MKSCSKTLVFLSLSMLLLPSMAFAQDSGAAGDSASPAFIIASKCTKISKIDFATTSGLDTVTTVGAAFVDLPGMAVSFTVPGTTKSCIKVEFSGMSFAANAPVASQLLNVRATLNGVPIPPPDVQFSGDDDEDADGAWARSHAFNWTTDLLPGAHVVKIQWRSVFGGSVFMHARTVAVHHK